MRSDEERWEIPWERTPSGAPAFAVGPPVRGSRAGAHLRVLAQLKMTDIELITAKVEGEEVTFEPVVVITSHEAAAIDLAALYRPAYPDEDVADLAIIRSGRWEKEVDGRGFAKAGGKRAYVVESQVPKIRIQAVRSGVLDEWIKASSDALLSGTSVEVAEPAERSFKFLEIEARFGDWSWQVRFSPEDRRFVGWASEATRWTRQINGLAQDANARVDLEGGCRVSYRVSLAEAVRRFPE
jgi:hypothetical protein